MRTLRILIVGGSTRAAADSVRRAGWQPVCADLFADLDLRRTADVIPVRNYPESLPDDVAHVQADGWFYCGALENHPNIIQRLQEKNRPYGKLLGTTADSLKLVRNPQWLAETFRSAGILMLDVAESSNPPATDGSWLQKPLASAGGRSIRVWDCAAAQIGFGESHYFQRRANGPGLSAIFRVDGGCVRWLGASRELQTDPSFPLPSAFSYCGSCGPLERIPPRSEETAAGTISLNPQSNAIHQGARVSHPDIPGLEALPPTVQAQLTTMAETLMKKVAGLNGIVGLDFRLDGETIWLTEVNPRYTASVEVLEIATGRSQLNPNAPARLSQQTPLLPNDFVNSASPLPAINLSGIESSSTDRSAVTDPRHRMVAKRILYAATPLVAPDLSRYFVGDPWQIPIVADIPVPGITIEAGWPICTVLADGYNVEELESTMNQRLRQVQADLSPPG